MWVGAGERNGAPAGGGGEAMVGSPEFVELVKGQFDVLLVSVPGADRVVLFARRENTETGEGSELILLHRFPPCCRSGLDT